MADTTHTGADAIFTQHWNVYNKILQYNFMYHQQLMAAIQNCLDEKLSNQTISMLDLGCGDAAGISRLLGGYNVAAYTGYDSSVAVLDIAAASILPLGAKARLVNGHLAQSVINETTPYNCVYSSFAIHHLPDEEKIAFFKQAKEHLLTDNGILIYVDVFRKEQQSRADYLDAYLTNMTQQWTALTPEEYALVEAHIRTFDFPAEKSGLIDQLKTMGYRVTAINAGDEVHSMLLLQKQ